MQIQELEFFGRSEKRSRRHSTNLHKCSEKVKNQVYLISEHAKSCILIECESGLENEAPAMAI